MLVEAAGQAGGAGPLGAEAGGQVGGGQGGQVAEGAQAEADQEVGQVGAVEGGHRVRGQEGAAAARGDDGLVAGGQGGGEGAVGNPNPAAAPTETPLVEVEAAVRSPVTLQSPLAPTDRGTTLAVPRTPRLTGGPSWALMAAWTAAVTVTARAGSPPW